MKQATQPGQAQGCNSSLNKYTKIPQLQQVGPRGKNKTKLPDDAFLSELWERRPQGPGPAKPNPPHLSKGNQSDQSGAAQWGWQTRPSPGLSSPPASAVGFQVTKAPPMSQKSVASPVPPWQGSLSDQVLRSPSPSPSPTGGLARGLPGGQQSVGRGWDDHKPVRFRFHSPPKEGVCVGGGETRPEFKESRLGLGSLHLGGAEGGTRPGRGRKAKKGAFDNIYAQNPRLDAAQRPSNLAPRLCPATVQWRMRHCSSLASLSA